MARSDCGCRLTRVIAEGAVHLDRSTCEYTNLLCEIGRLRAGLSASLQLQSHYAQLLNADDGGQREDVADVDAWMARLDPRKEPA